MRGPGRVLVALVAVAACGDEGLDFTGEPGAPVAAEVAGAVPVVTGVVEGAGAGRFLVDSGSPLTLLDAPDFGLTAGAYTVALSAFELGFPALRVASYDLATPWAGILGGDVLRHFALSIDYAGGRAWLDTAAVTVADVADPAIAVPAEVRGGGVFVLPNCADDCPSVDVGATRLLVDVSLEGVPARLLVDTGASAVVLEPGVLPAAAARPRLDGVTVTTASGPTTTAYVRIGRIGLGDTSVTSVPALEAPGADFFAGLEAEVGVEVDGLLGGSALREFVATLDYPARQLVLARYRDRDHIPFDEFIDVGFTVASRSGLWEVEDVYPRTDAAAQGLEAGERIVSIDGTTVAGLDRAAVDALFDRFGLGDEVTIGVDRAGATVTLSVAVEDLLPAYETP